MFIRKTRVDTIGHSPRQTFQVTPICYIFRGQLEMKSLWAMARVELTAVWLLKACDDN